MPLEPTIRSAQRRAESFPSLKSFLASEPAVEDHGFTRAESTEDTAVIRHTAPGRPSAAWSTTQLTGPRPAKTPFGSAGARGALSPSHANSPLANPQSPDRSICSDGLPRFLSHVSFES